MISIAAAAAPASQSALHPAGPDAAIIAQLGWILFGGGALVFVGVMAACALSLRKGRPVRPLVWIAGAGVLLPLAALSALLVFGVWNSAELIRPSSQHAVKISVVARMWWWEVRYTDPAGGGDIVLANEIRLPVGQPVYLGLSSGDVIHSFWVPALAGKVDTVPGRLHGMTLQADRAGVYRAQCAEYCGEQHARMALHVVAEEPAAFDAWLAAQAKPAVAPAPSSPELERGRDAFLAHRCNACHTVRGVSEESRLGPDLTHVGSRLHLGAGTVPNEPAQLAAWVAHTQQLKPGARMPSSGNRIGDADLQLIAGWLAQLK